MDRLVYNGICLKCNELNVVKKNLREPIDCPGDLYRNIATRHHPAAKAKKNVQVQEKGSFCKSLQQAITANLPVNMQDTRVKSASSETPLRRKLDPVCKDEDERYVKMKTRLKNTHQLQWYQ